MPKNNIMRRYGFVLDRGLVVMYFDDEENQAQQLNLKSGQTIWYVDADTFTLEQALSMAQQKAAELQAIKEQR